MPIKLLLATNNKGKLKEYRKLLEGIPLELVTPADVGITGSVAEIGSSFEENAILKATTLAKQSGLLTLADDSGLEVEVLNGEPGVMSARYAGDNATDADRVRYLLSKLTEVPSEKRNARFRCVIAIAAPEGRVQTCEGDCSGTITFEPKGTLGFGYDPIFYFTELNKTMAELTMDEKNKVSHRGKAAQKARKVLEKMGSWRVD